jgi:hypothetical protein
MERDPYEEHYQTTVNRRWFTQVEREMIAINIPLGSVMLSDKQLVWSQRRFNTINMRQLKELDKYSVML